MRGHHRAMKALYLRDSYMKSFDAEVAAAEGGEIILDVTAFYPQSGGQPSDLGTLERGGEAFRVTRVEPSESGIVHFVEREGLLPGESVTGTLDWDRRYRFMRSHTACHILSAVIFRETGAKITGNQIDLQRSRVDFSLETFDKSKMADYVLAANALIAEDRKVEISFVSREEAAKVPDLVRLAMEVPDREEIRVVAIDGVDVQACGGTHVGRTGEIGGIRLLKAENKGKANRRVYFELMDVQHQEV